MTTNSLLLEAQGWEGAGGHGLLGVLGGEPSHYGRPVREDEAAPLGAPLLSHLGARGPGGAATHRCYRRHYHQKFIELTREKYDGALDWSSPRPWVWLQLKSGERLRTR